jgi:hypothetical protein
MPDATASRKRQIVDGTTCEVSIASTEAGVAPERAGGAKRRFESVARDPDKGEPAFPER